jgi:hypothetical protein
MKMFTLKSHKLGGQFTPEYYYDEWGAGGSNTHWRWALMLILPLLAFKWGL